MISVVESCIEVSSLDCRYGGRAGLRDVNLRLMPGQVHGVLGPRWSGKTTLLRVLAGEVAQSSGSVWLPRRVALVRDAETQTRMALARAIASRPDLLLVDEPSLGLDAETAAAARSLVRRYAAQGGAVVWATRRLDTIAGAAGSVTVLAGGRTRYSGSIEALTALALPAQVADAAAPFVRAA